MTDLAAAARRRLFEVFGHEDFIGMQGDVIDHVLSGGDALVIMPTGGGKSLCYQLPALVLDGVAIVLSPLIALMQDQVDVLRRRGVAATFINSSLDRRERERRMKRLAEGCYQLVYVTPERFRKPEFLRAVDAVKVSLLAVDEAHCISTWGHDFRPEYGRVGRIRERLHAPPTIALTATATPDTQADIRRRLGIGEAPLFHAGIERPNLHIAVREVHSDEERVERILALIERLGGPGIVYMALIRDIRRLEERLLRHGITPFVYHGDLSAMERRDMQRRFLASRDAVVLATNAFGMGVDKPDIRFIVHGQIPGSVEAYYQEIGRAGRDGAPSLCELLYFSEDLMTQKQFVEWANPTPDFARSVYNVMDAWGENLYAHEAGDIREALLLKNRHDGRVGMVLGLFRAGGLIEGTFDQGDLRLTRPLRPGEEDEIIDAGKRERDLRRLLEIVEYARGSTCRRRALQVYFGFEASPVCGECDVCHPTEEWLASWVAPAPPPAPPAAEAPGEGDPAAESEADGAVDPDSVPVRRGDWLLINRKHHVVVRRVDASARGITVEVESATDLGIRTYDLRRVRWKKLD